MHLKKINKERMIIAILSILVIILGLMQVNTQKALREQQLRIDNLFKESLYESISNLTIDFNKDTMDDKVYRYITLRTGLDRADKLLRMTSYNEENSTLDDVLYNLQYYFKENPLITDQVDINKNIDIYNRTLDLYMNLNSERKGNDLVEYLDSIIE